MADAKARLTAAWRSKAHEDIAVARLLIRQEKRLHAAAVYHCQQAAEKMLKAWLTDQELIFPKNARFGVAGSSLPRRRREV